MAQFIATNYFEGNHFQQAQVKSEIPLANFYIKDANSGEQVMTIHKQHLVNSNDTVTVNIFDKSKTGTGGEKISQWQLKIYDPNNTIVYDSGWKTDPSQIENFVYDKTKPDGRWIFELSVKDDKGNESKAFQTYLTAFLDDVEPEIAGSNTGRNEATITLTDKGDGIDEDGITLIEDDRGSGVSAYYITDDPNGPEPDESEWIYLDAPVHTYDFKVDISEYVGKGKSLVIWTKEIIVLPEPPEPDDPESEFQVWKDDDGNPITPGTPIIPPDDDDEPTIIITPTYTTDTGVIQFDANGGKIGDSENKKYVVAALSSVREQVIKYNHVPVREGYLFTGWTMEDGTAITTQQVAKDLTTVVKAQWQIQSYKLKFNANGGSLGSVKEKELTYGTAIQK